MVPPERLNLCWNDFEANARLSFVKLRDEKEFFDVTVVADCGKQMEANKVVLTGGSNFFHKILKENPHPHPLVYLKGVVYKHLVYLMNFVYTGETSIAEVDLNDFLDIAHDLKVKGLTMPGTLETTGNQTSSRSSPAKEPFPSPRVSHPPHLVTSAAPDQYQVAAEERCLSLRMVRQSRPQSITLTGPAPHLSQALAQEVPPAALSHLHSVKSALPGGHVAANQSVPPAALSQLHSVKSALPGGQVAANQTVSPPSVSNPQSVKSDLPGGHVAANQTVSSPSVSNPQSVKSDLPGGQVAANQTVSSPSLSNSRSVKSALPQGQLAANETSPSSSRSNPHIPKSVLPRGKLAAEKAVPSLGIQSLRSAISSHLNNSLAQSSCEENHDNTFNVKVEVGDADHYNVVYGVNDRGEQYICHVSILGLEENGGNIYIDEGIVLSVEQEQNDQIIYTFKEPKEEVMESSNDMVIREAADLIFKDKQKPYDWYEQGEENEKIILGRNKDDKNNTIPDGEQDLADKPKSSEDTDFQCFSCSITFTMSSQLRRHKKSHMDEKQSASPVRSKMSSQMGSSKELKRIDAEEELVKSIHTGDKPFQCLRKNLNQEKMIHLKFHKLTHTQTKPQYQCGQCPKSFSQLYHLKQHKMIHTEEKPYQCGQCHKSFSQLSNLKRHMRMHTGEKPYQCGQCHKSFSQLGTLKQHKMVHTGEKPHQCVECPKSFSQLSDLKRHKMVHTGEKPHQCVECLKLFCLLGDLKRHKMIHTGVKPHQCVVCSRRFSRLAHLKSHKRVHTDEKP